MSIFRGLFPYEILIMGLGALLFVVMLIALMAYLFRGKSVVGLVVFFVLSIGMLGFPALKAIQYKDGLLSLEFNEQQLQRNPEDAQAREGLKIGLKAVEGRPADAKASLAIAKAQWAMGNEQAAVASLRPAISSESTKKDAAVLKERIDTVQKLEELTTRAEQNPSAADRAALEQQLNQVVRQPAVSPQTAATVARAHAALGQNELALQNAKKAVAINPNLATTPQLRVILQRH